MREKEEAIDNFEDRMHQLRMAESGRDYLLHTYLDQLSDKVQPGHTVLSLLTSLSLQNQSKECLREEEGRRSPGLYPGGVPPQHLNTWTESLAKLNKINSELTCKVAATSLLNLLNPLIAGGGNAEVEPEDEKFK